MEKFTFNIFLIQSFLLVLQSKMANMRNLRQKTESCPKYKGV